MISVVESIRSETPSFVPNHLLPSLPIVIENTELLAKPSEVLYVVHVEPSYLLTPPRYVPNHLLPLLSIVIERTSLSTNPSDVSNVFREVAAYYDGVYGNYELDASGDRCNYKIGVAKLGQDDLQYSYEVWGLYDVPTGILETLNIFP